MSAVTVKNGALVTAPDGNDNEITFDEQNSNVNPVTLAFIDVISGNIKFASGEAVDSANYAYPAGSKVTLPLRNAGGAKNIHYKCSTGNTFAITVI